MKLPISATTIAATMLILACSTEQKPPPEGNFTNPNGASELAILMNEMFADALAAKQNIEQGKPALIEVMPEKILTAAATEPEKVASPEYKAFAESYIQAVHLMREGAPDEAAERFQVVATACMNCHESLCPGPTKRIRKLFLPN